MKIKPLLEISENLKAQMKINEMIFMIIALVLFFSIVLMFWLNISLSGLKDSVSQSSRDKAIMLVSMLADSPELNCGDSKCIDEDKLAALINHPIYRTFWDVNGLTIERVTTGNKTIECSIGNYPNCNLFIIKKTSNNTIPDSTIVSLCRKESKNGYLYDKCDIGKIMVWSKV